MAGSIIPLSLDDELLDDPSRACFAYPVLLTLGWCFAVSALLSKTIVINTIFRKPAFQRVVLKRSDILKPMVLVVMGTLEIADAVQS
jgi:cytochrome c oxidase subunit IV